MPDGGRVSDTKVTRAPDASRVDLASQTEGEVHAPERELESRSAGMAMDPRVVSRLSAGQQVRLIQQMQRGYGNAQVARMMAQLQTPPAPARRDERGADEPSAPDSVSPAPVARMAVAAPPPAPVAPSVIKPLSPPAPTAPRSEAADDERDPQSDESADHQSVQRELAGPPPPPAPPNGSPVVQRSLSGAILNKAAEWAHDVPGYNLLTVILGKDPINDQPVPRTAVNFVHGVISLIPGGDAIFKNLQESGAIDQAFQWLNTETAKLGITWAAVKGAVQQIFDSLSWTDVLEPSAAWDKVKHIIMPLVDKVTHFALDAGKKLFEFVFEGALKLAGPLAGTIMAAIRKAGDVITTIAKDPVAFLGNLLRAVKGGFEQFMANIETHLKQGLMSWLFGSLAGAGIELPKTFDLKGILSLVLQILGLSWQNLRAKLVGALGEPVVSRVEKTVGFVKTIATEGISAAWQQIVQWITESIGNLKDMVLGTIKDWVVTTIIKQAVLKLVSMFNPVGAIIQAIMTIYNTVQFVIDKAKQIADLANAVLDSIANIASGNIVAAANYVEQTLGKAVPVVIGFLADLIGLGGITDKIKDIIQKIRQPIDKVMNKLVGFVTSKAKPIIAAVTKKGHAVAGWAKGKVNQAKDRLSGGLFGKKDPNKVALDAARDEAQGWLEQSGATPGGIRARLPGLQVQHGLRHAALEHVGGEYYIVVQRAEETTSKVALNGGEGSKSNDHLDKLDLKTLYAQAQKGGPNDVRVFADQLRLAADASGWNVATLVSHLGGEWAPLMKVLVQSAPGRQVAGMFDAWRRKQFRMLHDHLSRETVDDGLGPLGMQEPSGSSAPTSDMDISFAGPNAAAQMHLAQTRLPAQVGARSWDETKRLLDCDFFTDATRVSALDSMAKDTHGAIGAEATKQAQGRLNKQYELNVLAKTWNEVSPERATELARKLGVDPKDVEARAREIRALKDNAEHRKREELKADELHAKLLRSKDPKERAALAEELSAHQSKLNASLDDPYLTSGGTAKQVTRREQLKNPQNLKPGDLPPLSSTEGYQDVLDNLYMLEHTFHLIEADGGRLSPGNAKKMAKYAERLLLTAGQHGASTQEAAAARDLWQDIAQMMMPALRANASAIVKNDNTYTAIVEAKQKLQAQVDAIVVAIKHRSDAHLGNAPAADANKLQTAVGELQQQKSIVGNIPADKSGPAGNPGMADTSNSGTGGDLKLDAATAEAQALLDADNATSESVKERLPEIQEKHGLKSAELVSDGGDRYHVEVMRAVKSTKSVPLGAKMTRYVVPPFECDTARFDFQEFTRQVRGQEQGINAMTVAEWLANRFRYLEEGRSEEGKVAQQEFREKHGLGDEEAALHEPDQVAGGGYRVRRRGDRYVNSSIGSQWKSRIEDLHDAAEKVPERRRAATQMNVKLSVVKL